MLRNLHIGLVLLAAFALFLEVENTAIYTLWYEMDNDSFTATYCVNINHPELDCWGSCRLNSELNSLDDASTNPMQISKVVQQDNIHFYTPVLNVDFPIVDLTGQRPFLSYHNQYHFLYSPWVFRPPDCQSISAGRYSA